MRTKVLLCVSLLLLPMLASAEDKKYEIDGIWYKINLDWKTAEVTFGEEKYSGVVSIPDRIFVNDNDNEIYDQFSVTKIGEMAFKDCKDLTNVVLSKNTESIGREAFMNCVGLEKINFYDCPIGVISESAFENSGIELANFNETTTRIGENAFRNCEKLRSVRISKYIFELGAGAFYGCSELTDVTLRTTSATDQGGYETQLRKIEAETFAYCPKATIEIPEGIRVIGEGAFCGNERAVWFLPHSLESIESKAFQDCPVMKVTCYATKPPVVSPDAFDNPQEIVLFVPYADRYKSADTWKDFGTIKQESLPEDLKYKPYPPTIEYVDGQLHFSSMDDNVVFQSSIDCDDKGNYEGETVSLSATYHIRAEAYFPGKCSSEMVHAYLCWIDLESKKEEISTSINGFEEVVPVEAKGVPVLIERRGDMVIIKGAAEGTPVHIYNMSGVELVSGEISGPVTSFTALNSGTVIVKVGEYSIKIVRN